MTRPFSTASVRPPGERGLHLQFLLFCLVGAGNTLVDAGVYAMLVGFLDWRSASLALSASVIGFLAGAVHSFAWNSRVTFRHRWSGRSPVARFLLVVSGGAAISAAVFALAMAVVPEPARLIVPKAVAIAATLGWNFALARAWVFRRRPG